MFSDCVYLPPKWGSLQVCIGEFEQCYWHLHIRDKQYKGQNGTYHCVQITTVDCHSAGRPFWRIPLLISSTGLIQRPEVTKQLLASDCSVTPEPLWC